jgi:hypothetical protein
MDSRQPSARERPISPISDIDDASSADDGLFPWVAEHVRGVSEDNRRIRAEHAVSTQGPLSEMNKRRDTTHQINEESGEHREIIPNPGHCARPSHWVPGEPVQAYQPHTPRSHIANMQHTTVIVTARHYWDPLDEKKIRDEIIKTLCSHTQGRRPIGVALVVEGSVTSGKVTGAT